MTEAFNRRFLTVKRGTSVRPGHVLYPDSVFYGNNTATANLLPLAFGIVPDSVKDDVVRNVVRNIIITGNGHVTCGVIGISWLMRSLSDNGFADVAYMLATQRKYPSWGYMTENGATTIWELWNGDKANPSMNSGNHVMLLGDLLTWCYQYLAGIRQTAESKAYKHIVLRPSFGIEDCFSIDASYETPYGTVKSQWHKTLERLHWDVEIPANTTAEVWLPDGKVKNVGSGSYTFDCSIPHKDSKILRDEFLYEYAPFYSAHASTITELKNGDLLAAYFGGTWERNPDCSIWVSRRKKGSDHWDAPVKVADGILSGTAEGTKNGAAERKACWNPVLFTMPDGEILLFFKIGKDVPDWQGWVVKSYDNGKTWTRKEMLPKGFIGPVKNKPELIGDRLICPSSTEGKWWTFHVEIYNVKTKQWKYVGPVPADSALLTDDGKMHPIKCIQPSILRLGDGRLKVLMRTHNGKLATSYSRDNGDTWSTVTLTDIPNNQSGTDAVTLKDGRHVLVYNDFETVMGTKKGPRTPLRLAISDDGEHFRPYVTLEGSPVDQYSYPAVIQGSDGNLHVVYTWRRLRIAYKEIKLK
jgi:alpha-L-rhamnosidase